jgi:hypothetical protein
MLLHLPTPSKSGGLAKPPKGVLGVITGPVDPHLAWLLLLLFQPFSWEEGSFMNGVRKLLFFRSKKNGEGIIRISLVSISASAFANV